MAQQTQTTPQSGTEPSGEGQQGGQGNNSETLPNEGQQGGTEGGTPVEETEAPEGDMSKLPKWAQNYIGKLRNEAADHRVKAKNKAEEARREALSEQERAIEDAVNAEREKLLGEFESKIVRTQAEAALAQAKIVNPAKSIKLLDLDELKVNDEGEVEGLEAAVKQLKKDYPNLVESSRTDPNVGGGDGDNAPKGKTNMDDVLRRGFNARRGIA